ncbi:MAG: methyl-accepting chemotaxis protein [Clostridia bacterium]|nr:methyl-accepting chemotaxis protein [Clostridia bacterium]
MKLKYLLNRSLKSHSEQVFEGISKGRKKALDNWFKDTWVALELTRDTVLAYFNQNELNYDEITAILAAKAEQFKDFSELFLINQEGKVYSSTYKKNIGTYMNNLPNYISGIDHKPLMYGPYTDACTLEIGKFNSNFSDEVTLMFSLPFKNENTGRTSILCGRIPNDVMSDIIQDEDTHVYKDSGDNYLFMVKSNRGIAPGTAISRSRFEDDTFTMGENLKQGVKTKRWGVIQIKKHTEFEIVFTDPATGSLHVGVNNTIKNGENLDCWPGYPDYRHIPVGGKGIIINPPHSEEVWGMMCEGDIAEIYNFSSLSLKIPVISGLTSGVLIFGNYLLSYLSDSFALTRLSIIWILMTLATSYMIKKLVTAPLNKTITILQQIAEGEGDLTIRVNKSSKDEIGELSRWFNKFINNQMSLIKRIGSASKEAKTSAKGLSAMTESVKENTKVIETSVSYLIKNFEKQNKIFQTADEKFMLISNSIKDVKQLISDVSHKTQNTNEHALANTESSKKVLATVSELEDMMNNTLQSIIVLQKYSEEISQVTSLISSISKQTKLLALNASIESARAGEAGKGFAVVASEISKLAVESSEATESISKLISSVQNETQNTIQNVESIGTKVDEESSIVKASIATFNKIQEDISSVTENVQSISDLIKIQSDEINEISLNIQETAATLDKNTLKSANRSETALELVQSILTQTSQVEQVSKVLSHSSENLNDTISAFKFK